MFAAAAISAKARRDDQVVASYIRAQTLSDVAGERSNGTGAHELGQEGQFAALVRRLRGGASR
ncbi:MAG TPA: hypothetical protein VGF57_08770 [Roseiarcus sp.]